MFVVHHEAENVEEALAHAWSCSHAKSLALDVVDPAHRGAAMDAVRGDLDAAMPERLVARAAELRVARQAARDAAAVPGHDLARVAELRAAVTRAEAGAKETEARETRLAERLEGLPLWCRSERAGVRSSVIQARRDRERHVAASRAAKAELTRLGPAVERSLAVERARTAAREMSVELASIEGRLDAWAGRDPEVRARPSIDRARDRAGVERDRGRGR